MTNSKKYAHRMGTATVRLNGAETGKSKPVTVKQLRHQFLFGCSEFTVPFYASGEMDEAAAAQAEKRYGHMTEIFNSTTLPFYWGRFEPERGKPETERIMNGVRWLIGKGMTLKGHPLCWHTVCAPWLIENGMSNEMILETQLQRIDRDVTDFKGFIDMWDVINEVVIMPIFDKYDNGVTRICKDRGRINLVRDVFAAARKANPDAVLLINDFDTSVAYDILVEGLLEAGVPIDVIGIQSHMHQGCWSVEKTEEILERFSRFGLPLHFTEVTLVSGDIMPKHIGDLNDWQVESWPSTPEGEIRQAEETAVFYETLFAHPLVQSVTWWSFTDGLWLNAPAGLLDLNSDPKPVYRALHDRIKGAWWTDEHTVMSDNQGQVTVTGIRGTYRAVCDGQETIFEIA
jgi:GH35 family endo-1,4-beta-xylanase